MNVCRGRGERRREIGIAGCWKRRERKGKRGKGEKKKCGEEDRENRYAG